MPLCWLNLTLSNTFLLSLHVDKDCWFFQYPVSALEVYDTPPMNFHIIHYRVRTISKLKPFNASVKQPIWSRLLKYERMLLLRNMFLFVRNFWNFNFKKKWEKFTNVWDVLPMQTRMVLVGLIIIFCLYCFLCCKLPWFHSLVEINF